jgi:hypothetical protein
VGYVSRILKAFKPQTSYAIFSDTTLSLPRKSFRYINGSQKSHSSIEPKISSEKFYAAHDGAT